MIHGKDILIYEGDSPTVIAAAKSCTIDRKAGTVETSSPASGISRSYAAGRTDWEIAMNTLVLAMKDNLLRVGNVYTITMSVRDSATDTITGTAICTQCQVTGTVGNLAQGSFRFQGSDADGTLPQPTGPTGYDMTVDQVQAIVNNMTSGIYLSRTHADSASGLITLNAGAYVPTGQYLRIGDAYLTYDASVQMIKVWDNVGSTAKGLYATGGISALGAGGNEGGGGGGGGGDFTRAILFSWLTGAPQDSSEWINASFLKLGGGLTASSNGTLSAAISSIGLTMPTGFTVSNSPLTSSGTIAVTMSNGYKLLSSGTAPVGTYTKVTVDTYGRVVNATSLSASDIPSLSYIPLSGSDSITGALEPLNNNSYDIGASGYRWKDGYFAGTVYASSFSGNASSATKLNTARTLWGQSFDGSANVSGDMSGVGDMTFSAGDAGRTLSITKNGSIIASSPSSGGWVSGYRVVNNAADTTIGYSTGVYGTAMDTLRYYFYGGTHTSPSMVILPSGNVGIGDTAPSHLLDVNGVTGIGDRLIMTGTRGSTQRICFGDSSHYIECDANGHFHFSHGLYSDSFVSALGENSGGGGGGGGDFIPLSGSDAITGALIPGTNNTYNLGSSSKKWSTVYAITFNGTATKATADASGNNIASTYSKVSDTVTSIGISGNYITWTKNGSTSNITVPFATSTTTASKLGSSTVGSGTNPIYLSSGTATASSSTVGSSTRPVYLNSGTITSCGTSLAVSITGNAATATSATTASKLSTVSKTAWGQTYWTSGGVPTNISGDMSNVGDMAFSAGDEGRTFSITKNGNIILSSPSSGGWVAGYRIVNNAGDTTIGYSTGAYGTAMDTLKYFFYGGAYNSPSMVILPSGNVGIGTTDPQHELDVEGVSYASQGFDTVTASTDTLYGYKIGGNTRLRGSTAATTVLSAGASGGGIYFYPNGSSDTSNRAILTGAGRLGIGTVSPSQMLHVNGNILAEGGVTALSDMRKKQFLTNVNVGIDEAAMLPLFHFTWKDRHDEYIHIGTSAQAVQKLFPELVYDCGSELSLDYGALGTTLGILSARRLTEHEQRIVDLENENEALRERIKALEEIR